MQRTYEQNFRLDSLTPLIGTESATRVQLTSVEAELAELRSKCEPLEVRRGELLAAMESIEQAKSEATAIKTGT